MIRHFFTGLLLACSSLPSPAQTSSVIDWTADPKIHALSEPEKKEGAVIIMDERIFSNNWAGALGSAYRFYTYYEKHLIVHLSSDKAIEEYNKVYIPMSDAEGDPVVLKARAIAPDGKVSDMKSENIKRLENYENRGPFVLFAIDGIQKGGEIEYYYKIKKKLQSSGSEYQRSIYPCRRLSIELTSDRELKMACSGYNGLTDTTKEKNHAYFVAYNLKGRPREDYSAGDAVLPRVEYKVWITTHLSGFNPTNKQRDQVEQLNKGPTWERISKDLWGYMHNMTPKEIRKAGKLLKPLKLDTIRSLEAKIRRIEDYVKTNFKIKDTDDPNDNSISVIIKKHVGNASGITRLFMCLFEASKIDYQVAVTSNRYSKRFDRDFSSWSFLHDYLFCFPDIGNAFMSPTNESSRLGFPPAEYICNDALCFGGPSANYVIREVTCVPWEKNQSNINAEVNFDLDEDVAKVNFEFINTGYQAEPYQVSWLNIPSEAERQKYLVDVLDSYSGKDQPKNATISGINPGDLFAKACIMKMNYASSAMLEKAGPKYIFHAGDLIGPQSQLYSDTARVTDVENDHCRAYLRKLTIHIPEGYKISNPAVLNMDVHHDDNGNRTAEFVSSYNLEGSLLTVSIQETYRQLRYPASQYESFRAVINAAADFNKVVLFLEKK